MNVADAQMDIPRLQEYLRGRMDLSGPLQVQRLPGGQSNPTFELTTPAGRFVMRCKPAPAARLLPSAHAIEREYRVQAALAASGVPVPRMYCLCEDETIIGRAFYVMELVVGRILWKPDLPGFAPAERAAVYAEMRRVISLLHRLDHTQLGLGNYGKPGNYFLRQIERWSGQYRASETEPIEAMHHLMRWLPAHVPEESQPPVRIVHGDFRLDNLIFHPTQPRILAVIDWELSTLGHPLADFAYHAMSWQVPFESGRGIGGLDLTNTGIPSEGQYWEEYLQATGLHLAGDRRFYLVYNLFRIAAILQGVAKRAQEGIASSASAAQVGRSARPNAELAWHLARQIGDS
jgi:aminoglycoside phosphotransferase (APT) family kinase protein